VECDKPFGEATLSKNESPYTFSIIANQRQESSDYKKTFKGAPIDVTVILAATHHISTSNIQGFALRGGIPFPVVQWRDEGGDKQAKIVSCIAPQSLDTVIVKGNIPDKYSLVAIPLLAAWMNRNDLPVFFEMAIQSSDGQVYETSFNGTLTVKETDYVLPAQFRPPTPGMNQNGPMDARMGGPQGGGGQMGQMGGGPMGMSGMQQMGMQQNAGNLGRQNRFG